MEMLAEAVQVHNFTKVSNEPARLRIVYGDSGANNRTLIVNPGQEQTLEALVRRNFSIPSNLEVSLVLDDDIICYPVNLIDLKEARNARRIEVQTFPQQTVSAVSSLSAKSINVVSEDDDISTLQDIGERRKLQHVSRATSAASSSNDTNQESNQLTVSTLSSQHAHHESVIPQRSAIYKDNRVTDGRKKNRGSDSRRSYLKEEKVLIMWLRDAGKSAEEVSAMTSVSKSNIEKWCNDRMRETILSKFPPPKSSSVGQRNNGKRVLRSYLNSSGLRFDYRDRVAMQGALQVLLTHLEGLTSELNILLDADTLRSIAGIPTSLRNETETSDNAATTSVQAVENESTSSTPFMTALCLQGSDHEDGDDEDDSDEKSEALVLSMWREKRQLLGVQRAQNIVPSSSAVPTREDGEKMSFPVNKLSKSDSFTSVTVPESITLSTEAGKAFIDECMRANKHDSQITMQYNEQLPFNIPGTDPDMTTATSAQAQRSRLSNTRFLVVVKELLGLSPPATLEDIEDAKVLSMLGE